MELTSSGKLSDALRLKRMFDLSNVHLNSKAIRYNINSAICQRSLGTTKLAPLVDYAVDSTICPKSKLKKTLTSY